MDRALYQEHINQVLCIVSQQDQFTKARAKYRDRMSESRGNTYINDFFYFGLGHIDFLNKKLCFIFLQILRKKKEEKEEKNLRKVVCKKMIYEKICF